MITEQQLDVLRELINVGAGRGASTLNSFLNTHIQLDIPKVRVISGGELKQGTVIDEEGPFSSVEMKFSGSMEGAAELIFLSTNATKLVEIITGDERRDHDFDAIKAATFSEIGNIIVNAVLGSISNELRLKLHFTIPTYIEGSAEELFAILDASANGTIIVAETSFVVQRDQIEGSIAIFFGVQSFDDFIASIEKYVLA